MSWDEPEIQETEEPRGGARFWVPKELYDQVLAAARLNRLTVIAQAFEYNRYIKQLHAELHKRGRR